MATWSPDPEHIPWLEVVANATFVTAPIVAVDEEGMPASHYDFEIVGPRPKIIGLQVSQDEAGLVIAVPQVITGLYPPMEIEYQTPLADGGRQTGFCWDFPEIPVEADEIICFLRRARHPRWIGPSGSPRTLRKARTLPSSSCAFAPTGHRGVTH